MDSGVEHTVSESIMGVDLVKAQILVAQSASLSDLKLDKPLQEPRRVSI